MSHLGINRGNVRVLLRKRIAALLALAQVSRHRNPGVRVGKVCVAEHTIKLFIKCLPLEHQKLISDDGCCAVLPIRIRA